MIYYLTVNDGPTGIYFSQVTDVVKYLRRECEADVRLIALISIRGYQKNRRMIKSALPDALVLPMAPGLKRWKWNAWPLRLLFLLRRPLAVIGRSLLGTQLAMHSISKGTKVVYDGRGAIASEWKEYSVVEDSVLLSEVFSLERNCVVASDFRMAVSNELINYWRTSFGYEGGNHVTIPCTLSDEFIKQELNWPEIEKMRNSLGFSNSDRVLTYCGSLAGWQSFDLLRRVVSNYLGASWSILFICEHHPIIASLKDEFGSRVVHRKAKPLDVPSLLSAADVGILIREQSVTNQVASPVKFAEYLSSGLKVLISKNLGDYSRFVADYRCGFESGEMLPLFRPGHEEKLMCRNLALQHFSKGSHKSAYLRVLKHIE